MMNDLMNSAYRQTIRALRCALLCSAAVISPATSHAQQSLTRIEVVTPSRAEETLTRSTSIMSVITARDIERAGFRTVYDVLARVPGFFPTSQATWKLVGSRGLVADGNDHF